MKTANNLKTRLMKPAPVLNVNNYISISYNISPFFCMLNDNQSIKLKNPHYYEKNPTGSNPYCR
jgi:hypothetical protein